MCVRVGSANWNRNKKESKRWKVDWDGSTGAVRVCNNVIVMWNADERVKRWNRLRRLHGRYHGLGFYRCECANVMKSWTDKEKETVKNQLDLDWLLGYTGALLGVCVVWNADEKIRRRKDRLRWIHGCCYAGLDLQQCECVTLTLKNLGQTESETDKIKKRMRK